MSEHTPDLYVVRPKKQLLWPPTPELFEYPSDSPHSSGAFYRMLGMNRRVRVRGEAGYVVDLAAPYEREWCRGQEANLVPASELGDDAPTEASEVTLPSALRLIEGAPPEASVPGETEDPRIAEEREELREIVAGEEIPEGEEPEGAEGDSE